MGPIRRSPFDANAPGNSQFNGPRRNVTALGRKPAGTVTQLCAVVRSISPTPLAPSIGSTGRFSGHSICSMLAWNTVIRAGIDGLGSNGPTVLFSRKGAVDHRLTNDGGRV